MGNQDWLRSSNDFRLARRKNLQNFSKLWTNSKSSLARSGPDYPLRFATVKWSINFLGHFYLLQINESYELAYFGITYMIFNVEKLYPCVLRT